MSLDSFVFQQRHEAGAAGMRPQVGAQQIAQIDARYIRTGQPVEVTFKFIPGHVYPGKVVAVLQAISTGQVQASGLAATPKAIFTA